MIDYWCGRRQPATRDRQTGTVEIAAAGGIVFDSSGRLLLVRRGRPPGVGQWSIPGGKCQPEEPPADACVRELLEETGLRVAPVRWVGRVERPAPGGDTFVIEDFECAVVSAPESAGAGDDAEEVGWFDRETMMQLPLVPGLLKALTLWQVLPD